MLSKYLFFPLTLNLLFILNCETTTTSIQLPYPEITVSKTESWNDDSISYAFINTNAGNVPILYYLPKNIKSKSLIVALHYQNSNKEVWLNSLNGILKYAIESEIPFIAFDLYGHGEWEIEDYNTAYINEESLPEFMEPTTIGVSYSLRTFCYNNNLSLDSLHYVAISLGCFTEMDLSINGLKPQTMLLSAPVPLKAYHGTYSYHNNLKAFNNVNLLAISGSEDEYNIPGEVQEWFDEVSSNNKKLIIYKGGHVPPVSMIDSCVVFLNINN